MKKTLLSLGYREMTNKLYGKPVAYNLFCYKIEEEEFVNCVLDDILPQAKDLWVSYLKIYS